MEPLPSDVARLVLGYLSDTCPAAAAQFLAKSPDLAEVRRMGSRAKRPFGPSLLEILTEHATADCLVEDADSAVKWPGSPIGSGGFLYKLRRLLARSLGGAKGGAAATPGGSADTFLGGGGVWQEEQEALTADYWASQTGGGDWDEAPAVGGDCAHSPAGEAAVGDGEGEGDGDGSRWEGVCDSSHRPESPGASPCQETDSDTPALVVDYDSPADAMEDSETRPAADSETQTNLNSVAKTRTSDNAETSGASLEGTGSGYAPCDSGSGGNGGTVSDSGGDRPAAPSEDGRNKRKGRQPRRSDPEKSAALARSRTGGQPLEWMFGQVRHCPPSVTSTASVDSRPCQQQQRRTGERSEPEPSTQRTTTASTSQLNTVPLSLSTKKDLTRSPPAHPSALSVSSLPAGPTTGPSATPVGSETCPVTAAVPSAAAAGGGRHSARKKTMPRRRRALSECGTTVVQPGALRSRSPTARQSAESGSGSSGHVSGSGSAIEELEETVSPVKDARVTESSANTRVPEPHAEEGYPSNEDRVTQSSAKQARISKSPIKESRGVKLPASEDRTVPLDDPRSSPTGGASVRSLYPDPDSRSSPAPVADTSTTRSSPATNVSGGALLSPPNGATSDTCSPIATPAGGSLRNVPPGGADVDVSPSPTQTSQASGRSTPFSQRSLRICLSPTSAKTPSVNGSLLADETPTSARQSARRSGSVAGSRPGSGRSTVPRRRLLTGSRQDTGHPSAQSTPTAATDGSGRADGAGVTQVKSTRGGGASSPVVGLRRTPRRAAARRGGQRTPSDPAVTGSGSGRARGRKRPLPSGGERSPSPPAKVTPDNNRTLLKSIDIMSFLSRIHSVGGD